MGTSVFPPIPTLLVMNYVSSSSQSSSKRKKEQERCQTLIEKLREEWQVQETNNRLVLSWLSQEKDHWFSASE